MTALGSAATAGKAATARKLRFTPPGYPTYSGYTTVNIANDGSNRTQNLNSSTDYIITIDDYNPTVANLGGITLTSGRNIVIIGGRIRIDNVSGAPTQSLQTALKVHAPAGVLHLEGVDIGGQNCNDCIAIQAPVTSVATASTKFQIQNCRLRNNVPVGSTIAGGMHPDGIQFQTSTAPGFEGQFLMDKNTITTTYQGLFFQGPLRDGALVYRTNIHPIQDANGAGKTAHFLFWQETSDILVSIPNNDLYLEENAAESDYTFAQEMYPSGASPRSTEAPTVTTDATGTYATWAGGVGITGRIYKGNPAGGDYCPSGTPGIGYVSPGYL